MIRVRRATDRGHTCFGWLDSRHTFSFGHYHDPEQMGFGSLRVINDDRVAPGAGFDTHAHRDMEIVSVVLDGVMEHKDSLGFGSVIRAGDVQRMTAGTGITHSEFNHSKTESLRFLQIWVTPERRRLEPGYEQKTFFDDGRSGAFRLALSRDGRDGSLTLQQDADVYLASIRREQRVVYELDAGRKAWLQVARGTLQLNDMVLAEGDGAAISAEPRLTLVSDSVGEVLLFDMS